MNHLKIHRQTGDSTTSSATTTTDCNNNYLTKDKTLTDLVEQRIGCNHRHSAGMHFFL